MRTLLVDDSPDIRMLVERGLRRRDHEVVACGDAESAVAALQENVFSLIVLDWLLPGMDGLELCRLIRATNGDVPFILMITVQDRPEHLVSVLDAGADDYLPKPFTPQVLDVRLTIAERRIVQAAAQRRAQAELTRTQAVAANAAAHTELSRQQRFLLDLVGHELKTPLTTILGWSELLLSRELTQTFSRRALEMIHDRSGHLARIVANILDLAEMEAGEVRLVRSRLALNTHLPSWIAGLGDAPRVRVSIAPDLRDVLVDPKRLERAVQLLLRNALIYATDERPVSVHACMQGEMLAIRITDQGPGIPARELPHVFEAFYRTGRARTQALPGLGLGLALVRKIAELHGGQVHASSTLNKGSTFSLVLPAIAT